MLRILSLGAGVQSSTLALMIAKGELPEIDAIIRNQPKIRGMQFMHRSCVPLNQVDFSTAEDHGQIDMFNNECEGMCGV